MDKKKIDEQAQRLDDQKLEEVSGGTRVLSACSRANVIDADDGARDTSIFSSAARLASADNTELGAAARYAANNGDEEEPLGIFDPFPRP